VGSIPLEIVGACKRLPFDMYLLLCTTVCYVDNFRFCAFVMYDNKINCNLFIYLMVDGY